SATQGFVPLGDARVRAPSASGGGAPAGGGAATHRPASPAPAVGPLDIGGLPLPRNREGSSRRDPGVRRARRRQRKGEGAPEAPVRKPVAPGSRLGAGR